VVVKVLVIDFMWYWMLGFVLSSVGLVSLLFLRLVVLVVVLSCILL